MVKLPLPGGLMYDQRGRHRALSLDGDVMTFRCPCGRTYSIRYGRQAQKRAHRIEGDGLLLMFRRWQDGCTAAPCPACRREWRKTGELPAAKEDKR